MVAINPSGEKLRFLETVILDILSPQRCPPVPGRFEMTVSDLGAPVSASRLASKRSAYHSLQLCLPALLLVSFALVGAVQSRAQDQNNDQKSQAVAEAARRERARKQSQARKSKHVYTAEDLKRERILTPEDRAQVEARKNAPTPAGTQKPQDAVAGSLASGETDAESLPSDAPLGNVARRLRKQKQSQQLQRSAEFPLPFADAPVLASPKPPVQPLHPPVMVRPPVTVIHPAPRVVAPLRPFVKRSPFERPRILPRASEVPRTLAVPPRTVAPGPAPPTVLPAPSPPRVHNTPSPSISGKLAVVTVKPGDSLWKFAAERLGNGRRWQELLALNPGLRNPDVIKAGREIVLPVSVASRRTSTKYTVLHGDTLWTIAQSQLGRATFWSCIAHANPDVRDANLIHGGQVLLLPASCPR